MPKPFLKIYWLNGYAQLKLAKGLKVRSSLSIGILNNDRNIFSPSFTAAGRSALNTGTKNF